MDWRDRIAIERKFDGKLNDDIIKLRSMAERGFYNIKILKKEERAMTYFDFLARLQDEMAALQSTDISAVVDEKVAEFRAKTEAEELAKLNAAKERKQIEIDTINGFIDCMRAEAEACETAENVEEE